MEKAYKFRIYPNKQQEELINKTFGCCRFVYNKYLAKKIELYENNKETYSYKQCSSDLTNLKKELLWLKEVDSTSLQSSLKDLETAYKKFFKEKKYCKSFYLVAMVNYLSNKYGLNMNIHTYDKYKMKNIIYPRGIEMMSRLLKNNDINRFCENEKR